jgi:cytochrome c peroxidase
MKIAYFLVAILSITSSTWCDTFQMDTLNLINSSHEEKVELPYGLPPIPWPKDNSYNPQKAELGRLLYFDTRLSSNGTISCASCHAPSEVFSDRRPVSIGILGQKGTRHSMTIINSAYQPSLFWDGRAKNLEEQCKGPIANPKEMSLIDDPHEAHAQCQERVKNIKGYRLLFQEVFHNEECSMDDIAKAIATFERTVLSGNSPYDRYIKGDKEAITEEQIQGYALFIEKRCIDCHHGVNFSSGEFTNIGIGMDKPSPDLGRYAITKKKKDWGAFKVPVLREVAYSHPYMHDGSLNTLEEVIDYYDRGGNPNPNLHPLMQPLNLTPQEKKALISFLHSLSGEGWRHIRSPEQFPE